MSIFKVGFLMIALMALISWIANALGGPAWAIGALAFTLIMNVGAFWFSDKLVIKMTKAQPVSPAQAPELYEMVNRLSQRAQIPNPTLYIVNDPSPNAFATGRDPAHGVVAVNTGLLNLLDQREVEGVIAHEIAHIKHRDTLTMAVVAALAGTIMLLANIAQFMGFFMGGHDEDRPNPLVFLLIAILGPFAAMIIQATISRAREYEADRMGAELAGRPDGLANALRKLESGAQQIPTHTFSESTAHLAIINPLRGGLAGLFSTHPPTEERIKRLMALESSRNPSFA
jgi:heat shock protein HtpX